MITEEILKNSLSFEQYLQLTEDIVSEKIKREGKYAADNTFKYTGSNLKRMHLVQQQITLNKKLYNLLSNLNQEWIWVVITEPWCGDASWGVPALAIIASVTENVSFRILLRDTPPVIIQHYQTEGTDSIPKLVCIRRKDWKELGTWGPRPQILQQQILQKISGKQTDYKEQVRAIHAWCEADMTASIQTEMIDCIKLWSSI